MKIIILGNYTKALVTFRGPLIKRFVDLGHTVTAYAPDYDQETIDALLEIGANFKLIPFDRTGTSVFHDSFFFIRLWKLLVVEKPDILLSYTIKPVIYGSLAAKLAGVKSIYSIITGLGYVFIGDNAVKKYLRLLVSKLYAFAISKNTSVFFLNKDDLTTFFDNKIIKSKGSYTLIHGEGVDISKYSKIEAENKPTISVLEGSGVDLNIYKQIPVPSDGLVFLLIARLLKDKGIREYVDAARSIKFKYPSMEFWLVGPLDSNPSAISSDELQQWVTDGVINYYGETRDVRPYISKASVYILPSYREGVPRTVLEAMAMGRPIITTDAPGCKETVIDGYNGFLVPIKDSVALANAIENFISNPELIFLMGRRSREIAEERFDVNKVNDVILKTMGMI